MVISISEKGPIWIICQAKFVPYFNFYLYYIYMVISFNINR